MVLVGNFKKYGKFREQAICIFRYDGWNLTILLIFLVITITSETYPT